MYTIKTNEKILCNSFSARLAREYARNYARLWAIDVFVYDEMGNLIALERAQLA